MESAADKHGHTNRLAKESSPYLLQHQHNPVDWYAWGTDAFDASRAQGKPIFLSVGYSTCFWCHVMERQSFENEAVAAEMNQRFINIKVDREERPDVDQLYMAAVQVLTRQGGWPMSVFLTPDLRPFYGGTYFPPQDMYGRPGFVSVLRGIDAAFRERRGEVDQTAEQLVNILRGISEPESAAAPMTIDEKFIDALIDRSTGDYEPQFGGFGMAPKFPRETLLELLLVHQRHAPDESRLKMIRHALDAMADGGIRDQLGGGFHRYSTDSKWLVPHFEIMLYDNAMLGWCYVEAYRQTEDRRYAQVARGVFDFILREMTSPEGAFYTAFDAEVDAQEGLSYLWTADEIERILGADDAKVFNRVYGVDRGANFADPHHGSGTPDKSILYVADRFGLDELHDRLEPMRQKLKAVRDAHKQPLLDTKILTSWNALMIRALAYGGQILNEQRYLNAATAAADFLLRHHRMPDGGLYRTSRDGNAKYAGFLDDYAYLIQALIDLRNATGRDEWKDHAARLAMTMLQKFEDPNRGGFYFTEAGAADLIVRQKTAADSPLPSGNAVAAMAMQDLGQPQIARRTLEVFAASFDRMAEAMSSMVQAAHLYVKQHGPIEVKPSADAPARRPVSPEQIAAGVVLVSVTETSASTMNLALEILDGFHINAHDAAGGMVATSVAAVGVEIEVDYPPGEQRRFAFADEAIRVYDKAATIAVRFKAPPPPRVTFRLTYQACTDNACLPAVTKQFEWQRV